MYEVNPYGMNVGVTINKEQEVAAGKSTFSDLVKAQMGYQYDPIYEYINNEIKYADEEDPTYNASQDMEGFEEFSATLINAKNAEHMADMKRHIRESQARREIMYEHGFLANVAAGLFDPINLVALPFGGAGLGRSVAQSALRVGAGTATIQTGLEIARAPFDPVGTLGESAFNIGAAAVTGGILGGLVALPAARKAAAQKATVKDMNETIAALEEITTDDISKLGKREEREFGQLATEELDAINQAKPHEIKKMQESIEALEAKAKKTEAEEQQLRNLRTGMMNAENDLAAVQRERAFRRIEDTRNVQGLTDPYKIAESWFTNSWIYNKLIPTPMKDTLQSAKVPTVVKKAFVNLAGDKGITLAMHKLGITDGDGVYVSAKVREGEWVQIYDQLIKNFGEASGKGDFTFMDHNFQNIDGSFSKYLESINAKYIKGIEGETDLERESIKLMANFWEKWGKRLSDVGLIGNKDFMSKQMSNKEFKLRKAHEILDTLEAKEGLSFARMRQTVRENNRTIRNLRREEEARGLTEAQIEKLNKLEAENKRFSGTAVSLTKNQQEYIDALELRIARLEDEISELDVNLMAIDDDSLSPNEPMFSRYWNKQAIAERRAEFKAILVNYFTNNPSKFVRNIQDTPIKRNLLELDDAEIIRLYGEEFNVNKIVTGKKAVQAIKKQHPKGALGMHQYFDQEKGIIYLDRDGVYLKYRKFKQSLKNKEKAIQDMRNAAGKNKDLYASAAFHHNMFMLNNSDSFKSFADFQDFVTLHELSHGKFKKAYREEDIEYEMRVNDEALKRMKEIHKQMRTPPPAWIKQEFDTDPRAIDERAEQTIKEILEEVDPTAEVASFYGHGKSKHFRHRTLDIPNSLVYDFIVNDPIAVMKAYTARVAPRYEFAKQNNGRSLDDILDDIEDDMRQNRNTTSEINEVRKNYAILYDRVVGSTLREPHSWDARLAQVMRDAAQLNYLGSAGFSTLPDFAKILMEHDGKVIIQMLKGAIGDKRVRMSAEEGRIAGQILEILTGSSHMRLTEELSNSPFSSNKFDTVYTQRVDTAKNLFYKLNLLAPFTRIFKQMDSMARCHTLVDYSVKITNGTATEKEITYMARYGFDKAKAKEITRLANDGIIERVSADGLYLPNTRKWPKEDEGLRDTFRAALNSGIENTVLMGTPADKPVLVDGVFHIPMRLVEKLRLPLTEDAVVRGYARLESPLLGMPFQFMSYSFAAVNKITAAYAHDQAKNKAVAISAAMGLGFMSVYIKTPEFAREKMSTEDWIARSFDMSGLAALYSDAMYTSMVTSLAFGGPNITGGIVNPKYPVKKDTIEGIVGPLGTGPNIAHDIVRYGMYEFVTGNYGEGSKNIIRNLPFARLWFLKDYMNEGTRYLSQMGRY